MRRANRFLILRIGWKEAKTSVVITHQSFCDEQPNKPVWVRFYLSFYHFGTGHYPNFIVIFWLTVLPQKSKVLLATYCLDCLCAVFACSRLVYYLRVERQNNLAITRAILCVALSDYVVYCCQNAVAHQWRRRKIRYESILQESILPDFSTDWPKYFAFYFVQCVLLRKGHLATSPPCTISCSTLVFIVEKDSKWGRPQSFSNCYAIGRCFIHHSGKRRLDY